MNSNTTTNKSTKELKDQVLQDIQRVKDDFNEIKSRATPGQLIDEAIFYRRGDTHPAATFEYLKNNPVGTSLLTLGTLLLMEDENHLSYEARAKSQVTSATHEVKEQYDKLKTKMHIGKGDKNVSETFDAAYGTSKPSSVDQLKESGKDFLNEAERELSHAKSSIKSSLHSASETAQSAADATKRRFSDAKEGVKNMDPMTYLALGAGLGVVTGAALPVSEKESSVVDEQLEAKLTEFTRDLESAINQSANILKNEFIGGMTEFKFNLFGHA